jgi:GDSL-like Lipase/Acylhydrolase.
LPKLQSVTADMIIIGLGANDTFCLKSPRKWIKDIDNLITALQQIYPNSPIYFTNMPPIKSFPAFTKSLQFCLGNLAILLGNSLQNYVKQKHGVYYNSEQITLKKWQKKHIIKDSNTAAFFSDGVHPNTIGYRLWGTDMAFFVRQKKTL